MEKEKNSKIKDNDLTLSQVFQKMMWASLLLAGALVAGLWFMSSQFQIKSSPQTMEYHFNRKSEALPSPEIPGYKWPSQKATLVSFWAAWCEPCLKEMPALNHLPQKLNNLQVVLINIDDPESDFRKSAEKFLNTLGPLNFTHFFLNPSVAQKFKMQALPSHYLVSSSRNIVWSDSGIVPWDSSETLNKLQSLINDSLK